MNQGLLGFPQRSGGGGVLAYIVYNPITYATYTTTSTTYADVDATNLAVTFTAPASGTVLIGVWARMRVGANVSIRLNMRSGAADVAGTGVQALTGDAENRFQPTYTRMRVTGLTSGTSYTYKLGWALNTAGTGTLERGASTQEIPAIIEVWSA